VNRDWQKFILNEDLDAKDIFTFIQGLHENLTKIKPKTMTQGRRLGMMIHQIKEIKKYARKLQNENQVLQEKLNILEESLNENEER
jgi:regulator of replication initiation timing